MAEFKTVTRDNWSVSCTTGSDIKGAVLNVGKHYLLSSEYKIRRGDGDGRLFPNSDAAWAFALERGYTQQFVTSWCRDCRVVHTSKIGQNPRKTGFCPVTHQFVH